MKDNINNGVVSCVIPTYKRSDTLVRAINSVLSQTYKQVEILVVDDNEPRSEESRYVQNNVQSIKDGRVKLITQERHINGAEARNAGIRAAIGEYVAFLDDDDEWLPTKLERQLDLMQESGCDGVSCLYNEFLGDIIIHSCPPYTGDNLHKKIFQREVAVFTSTVLLKKQALLEAGIFNNTLRRHQDLQLLLDFTKSHRIEVLCEYLVKLHCDSPINNPSYENFVKVKTAFFDAMQSHLQLYTKSEQRQIFAAHRFELAFAAIKEKRFFTAMGQILKVGINIPAYKCLYKRFKDKKFVANS